MKTSLLLLCVLMPVKASAVVVGTTSHGYSDIPVPYISVQPGMNGVGIWKYEPEYRFNCHITVTLYGPDGPGGFPKNTQYRLEGQTGPYSCFGVDMNVDDGESAYNHLRFDIVPTLQLPMTAHRPNGNWAGLGPGIDGQCMIELRVGRVREGKWWFRYTLLPSIGACGHTPEPVSCSVVGPGTMQHRDTVAGRIRSTAYGDIDVKCTGRASVNLTVSGEVELTSGDARVASTLSLVDVGRTTTTVIADPNAAVRAISQIDGSADKAGAYAGVGVIIGTWD